MGILYSVAPLEGQLRGALPEMGVRRVPTQDGRNPTPAELRIALSSLEGYKVTYSDPPASGAQWQAWVEDRIDPEAAGWTLVNITEYKGPDEPTEIWFEKGWPELIVRILVNLVTTTGPLVLFADCGGAPLVIQHGDNAAELYRTWQLDEDEAV